MAGKTKGKSGIPKGKRSSTKKPTDIRAFRHGWSVLKKLGLVKGDSRSIEPTKYRLGILRKYSEHLSSAEPSKHQLTVYSVGKMVKTVYEFVGGKPEVYDVIKKQEQVVNKYYKALSNDRKKLATARRYINAKGKTSILSAGIDVLKANVEKSQKAYYAEYEKQQAYVNEIRNSTNAVKYHYDDKGNLTYSKHYKDVKVNKESVITKDTVIMVISHVNIESTDGKNIPAGGVFGTTIKGSTGAIVHEYLYALYGLDYEEFDIVKAWSTRYVNKKLKG
jgi:hypothetical protein